MDGGPERITDEKELATVRRQAHRVHVRAALLTVALTVLALLIP